MSNVRNLLIGLCLAAASVGAMRKTPMNTRHITRPMRQARRPL